MKLIALKNYILFVLLWFYEFHRIKLMKTKGGKRIDNQMKEINIFK